MTDLARLRALDMVVAAARRHYEDESWWGPVRGAAYFESNLRKAENRRKLGEAIAALEREAPASNRLRELAQITADAAHWQYVAEDDYHYGAHRDTPDTCPHPDCVLVRQPVEPDPGQATRQWAWKCLDCNAWTMNVGRGVNECGKCGTIKPFGTALLFCDHQPPVEPDLAPFRDLAQQWRDEAALGSTHERGQGRDEAMVHCAAELDSARQRQQEQEPPPTWLCGCGTWNGVNLARCRQCNRASSESDVTYQVRGVSSEGARD